MHDSSLGENRKTCERAGSPLRTRTTLHDSAGDCGAWRRSREARPSEKTHLYRPEPPPLLPTTVPRVAQPTLGRRERPALAAGVSFCAA
ncbi:hypothetical protein MRX96_016124 [Rhipicephalus microplus]